MGLEAPDHRAGPRRSTCRRTQTCCRLNVGIGRIGHLEGLPKIEPDGRFVIIWKFNPGQGVLHPWFSVGTLSESAFPYAPGTSKKIVVTVGEPTPAGTVVKGQHRTARKPQAQADKEAQAWRRPPPRRGAPAQPLAPGRRDRRCIRASGPGTCRATRYGPDRAGTPRSASRRFAPIARTDRCCGRDRDRSDRQPPRPIDPDQRSTVHASPVGAAVDRRVA